MKKLKLILKNLWLKIVRIIYSKIFSNFILILVILSIFSLVITRLLDFSIITNKYIATFDYIAVIIFAVEFIVKFASKKWIYLFRQYGWIDLLSSLPILSPAIKGLRSIRLLRLTRTLRLLRLLKFTKQTNSPLKQKFFTALSSFSLIIIMGSGYAIYEYQNSLFKDNLIKDLTRILSNAKDDHSVLKLFQNNKYLIRVDEVDHNNKKKQICLKIRIPDKKKYYDIIRHNYKPEYVDFFKELIKLKNINLEIKNKYGINQLEPETLFSDFDVNALSDNSKKIFFKYYNLLIKLYYPNDNRLHAISSKNTETYFKYLTDFDYTENTILKFGIDSKYIFTFSIKKLTNSLRYFEVFIIAVSIFSVVLIVAILNVYFEKVLLNRITKLSDDVRETLTTHQLKNIHTGKLKHTDEIDYLVASYFHLREQIDNSFLKKNSHIKILKIFNTVYSVFQKTFDITKHFHYLLITATCKQYLRFDRAILFIFDIHNEKYKTNASIGCLSIKTLKNKFKKKEDFYKFHPSLEESLNLYKELPYFDEEFDAVANSIELSKHNFNNNIKKAFEKDIMFKYPSEIKIEADFINELKEKLNTDEFLLIELKSFNETFGILYLDNNMSGESITNERIENTKTFINEFIKIFNNTIYLNFINEISHDEKLNKQLNKEKEKTFEILKTIFKFN